MLFTERDYYQDVIDLLANRGVDLEDIAILVQDGQKDHIADMPIEMALSSVQHVLHKTEVQDAIMTGLAIDDLAEANLLPEPLASRIASDHATYGIDEQLVMSILGVYGTISWTNFGFLDRTKPGIVGRLNQEQHAGGRVNTFIDDIVAAVAAAAEARIAHD
ncbi:phosphatidylglycerophosphatase A [Weissella soli]|uniref:Phosphatidylglycerophosphatase A n=1 Tax=Weissella soli TaxID=155866 RepID=A0A288Q7D2_9LACO|nr:phosphatidylglycerophosphatase A [Weissella soli]AOT57199.1 Phosphatidylglycerophosphatase [Weissella soli]MCT8394283.1 phosphatidylglycerophosphatase A [Weissella soli]NKY83773.1 phosphatidylglycerophosphatase A [Weissella soli]QEA35411.1 phosphatidylglycerophosphatase A [Weissella soli]RDL06680.1 phosphatidylglycerophosphatase A [Weissella soli]